MMSDNPPTTVDAASNGDEVSSPQSRRRGVASQWASVVRGSSEQNSSPVAAAASVAPRASLSPPRDQSSASDNSLIESSGSEAQPEGYDVNDDSNAGRPRRPAWNRPLNGVVEPVSVMGGAVSWPALSETTRPISRSLSDNSRPVSDGFSSSQAPILSQPPQRPANDNANANSAVNNPMPTRPRSRNRNGGSSAGIGPSQNAFNQLPLPMPLPFPFGGMVPAVLDASVRGTRPVGGLGGSPSHSANDHPQRNNSRRGGYGPRSRGDGQYHNNHGGRRDQGRRDVHQPPPHYGPPHMGYMPSHLPPGVSPFIAPAPMRVFPGQMGFDMTAPFFYYPTIPPESFRPMPVVPPPGPPPFPASNGNNLTTLVLRQIEFYFSDDNLVTDNFLRSKMDDQGWVPITLVATFRRVRQLTTEISMILESLRYSTVVEVQGDRVRRRNEWSRWLPPPSWLNFDSGSQVPGASENELATSLQGVSLNDTRANVNGSRNAMEGHTEITAGRTGQSAEEARAISV